MGGAERLQGAGAEEGVAAFGGEPKKGWLATRSAERSEGNQKCFFAKAKPEPVLRYFSKAAALS